MANYSLVHTFYGCDTGCCGYALEDAEGNRLDFTFDHPYDNDYRLLRDDEAVVLWARLEFQEHLKPDDTLTLDREYDFKC